MLSFGISSHCSASIYIAFLWIILHSLAFRRIPVALHAWYRIAYHLRLNALKCILIGSILHLPAYEPQYIALHCILSHIFEFCRTSLNQIRVICIAFHYLALYGITSHCINASQIPSRYQFLAVVSGLSNYHHFKASTSVLLCSAIHFYLRRYIHTSIYKDTYT